jgi:hypothetical protein
MSPRAHRLYVGTFISIVIAAVFVISYEGFAYYLEDIDQRYFHPDHVQWKPSGFIGHGLGIFGSLFMVIGVFGYMARKRIRRFSRLGLLKYWLEAHIFLCTIGPFFVLFHTAFKFGGIVSISFWSMVAVALSGVVGRFIYIQIPKTIEGRQLSKNEIEALKIEAHNDLVNKYKLDISILDALNKNDIDEKGGNAEPSLSDKAILKSIKKELAAQQINKAEKKQIIQLVKQELTLNNRIKRLERMQKLFEYWHVVHLPFGILMLVIMIVHIVVALLFGYQWIF